MFNLKRNQVIITVLVFMIAIAAYLNTQEPLKNSDVAVNANTDATVTDTTQVASNDAQTDNNQEEIDFFDGYNEVAQGTNPSVAPTATAETKKENLQTSDASDSSTINAVITKKDVTSDAENTNLDENVAASTNIDTDFFAEQKLERDQNRTEQIEQLTEYINNVNADQDSKSKAATNLIQIQERIDKENSAETLLKAKGFTEVYVRINDDTVDVVVNKADLTDADIAQIEEIVNRNTGYSVSKIHITPLKGVQNK